MKSFRAFLFLPIAVILFSCQKEAGFMEATPPSDNGGGDGEEEMDISGTWNYAGQAGNTSNRAEFTEFGQTVAMEAVLNYHTTQNTGTVVFASTKMNLQNVGHQMIGDYNAKIWVAGILFDEMAEQVDETVIPFNQESTFHRIGTDSLYFPGFKLSTEGSSLPELPPLKIGAKLSMRNDTLFMRLRFDQEITVTIPDVPTDKVHTRGDITMALTR